MVRTQFLLFKNPDKQTNKQTKTNKVRKKAGTQFLLLKKKSHDREKR